MSDDQINRTIFEHIYGSLGEDKDMLRVWQQGKFQPCNSWADAGPIIEKRGLSLKHIIVNRHEQTWQASFAPHYVRHKYTNKNPLRAAMIVFLMMHEND